jgi:hypothetical protein
LTFIGKTKTMKRNFILIAALLALSLSWVGCNKSSKPTGKLAEPSTLKTPPSGPVELKVKWSMGERIVQAMDTKMNMEISVPGRPAPVKQNMTMGQQYGLTVLKENPDGGHEVEMEFLNAKMGMESGGKTVLEYDSAKKSSTDQPNPVADMFGKIVGAKLQFYLNASNEVERVEGVDELIDQMSSGGPANGLAALKDSLFSKDRLKEMMSANRFLPPKAVQPGDTWPVKQSFELGSLGTMATDFDCTFVKWEMHGERNCARIEFQGTFNSTPGTNATRAGMSMSILNGNSSGVTWFDPDLGITIDTTMNQDITMLMSVPLNLGAKPGAPVHTQSITNQINQVMNIKLVSVK